MEDPMAIVAHEGRATVVTVKGHAVDTIDDHVR